jgi:hypothetical protein
VELSFVQPPHAQPHALAVHAHHLQPAAGPIAEHVGATVNRRATAQRLHRQQQPVETGAQVDRRHDEPPAGRAQHLD